MHVIKTKPLTIMANLQHICHYEMVIYDKNLQQVQNFVW